MVRKGAKMTPDHLAKTRRAMVPVDEAELRRMAEARLSCKEMSAALGVNAETVRRRLKALNIPRLPAKARPGKNSFWEGGYAVDQYGYILVKAPGHPHANRAGYVRQHRLVMEQQVGRYLAPEEVVHHENEDESDNRPENLRLFECSADHLAHHRVPGEKRLRPEEREALRLAAVQRAHQRVAAILAASGTGAQPSP